MQNSSHLIKYGASHAVTTTHHKTSSTIFSRKQRFS
jgi:hypothetical protein